jgi:hypothetical protein
VLCRYSDWRDEIVRPNTNNYTPDIGVSKSRAGGAGRGARGGGGARRDLVTGDIPIDIAVALLVHNHSSSTTKLRYSEPHVTIDVTCIPVSRRLFSVVTVFKSDEKTDSLGEILSRGNRCNVTYSFHTVKS